MTVPWFYKENTLYVPMGSTSPDPKWRQRLFHIQGLDEDLTKENYYIVNNARRVKVKEMKDDAHLQYQYMLIDCYAYLFKVGNACSYIPDQNKLILIDERRQTSRAPQRSSSSSSSRACKLLYAEDDTLAIRVVNVFEKALDRMVHEFDSLTWDERNDMIADLRTMLEAKGWQTVENPQVGTCCFCQGACNPQSQSCGVCARKLW